MVPQQTFSESGVKRGGDATAVSQIVLILPSDRYGMGQRVGEPESNCLGGFRRVKMRKVPRDVPTLVVARLQRNGGRGRPPSQELHSGQRLLEVGDDVGDVLDADREADDVRTGAGGDLLLGGELAMGGRGGMNDQALGVADVGEV